MPQVRQIVAYIDSSRKSNQTGALGDIADGVTDRLWRLFAKTSQDPTTRTAPLRQRAAVSCRSGDNKMLAVYGTALFCGGILLWFFMLHLHRKPGVAHWLETRSVGELTLYVCMLISLYGIAMVGQYGVKQDTPFGILEGVEVIVVLIGTVLIIRSIYLPPPPPKEASGAGRQAAAKTAPQKRAA